MQISPAATLDGFDYFLLGVVAVSTVLAFLKGFIRVAFSLLGLIAGLTLASWDYEEVAKGIRRFLPSISSFDLAEVLAFVLILLVIMLISSLLGSLLVRVVSGVGLGLLDRLAGAGFGLLRGCLLGVAVMMGIAAFLPGSGWIRRSVLAPYFLAGAHGVCSVVPDHFARQVSIGAAHLLQGSPQDFTTRMLRRGND